MPWEPPTHARRDVTAGLGPRVHVSSSPLDLLCLTLRLLHWITRPTGSQGCTSDPTPLDRPYKPSGSRSGSPPFPLLLLTSDLALPLLPPHHCCSGDPPPSFPVVVTSFAPSLMLSA